MGEVQFHLDLGGAVGAGAGFASLTSYERLRTMVPSRSARTEAEARWSGAESRDRDQLERVTAHLEETGWAAALVDSEWKLVWVSDQLRMFMGGASDGELGVGLHYARAVQSPAWAQSITSDARKHWLERAGPYLAHDTPGGVEALKELVHADDRELLERVKPVMPPPLWGWTIEFLQDDLPPATARCLSIRHETVDGVIGTSLLYGADLPATLLALLARGDSGMYSRMARLVEPARRSAAILFVDVCSSATLSRRLPTATYFALIQAMMTAVDDVLARHRGVVGKHVGDGATGFFLCEELGSESATARAAVEAAEDVRRAAREAAVAVSSESVPLGPEEVALRVGIHWGWSLFMGQVVRGGRLEVSALGDEVNECARIEESAPAGGVLASKALIERLGPRDADELGLDADRIRYSAVGELPAVGEKARRDAGGLAVTELFVEDKGPDGRSGRLPEASHGS